MCSCNNNVSTAVSLCDVNIFGTYCNYKTIYHVKHIYDVQMNEGMMIDVLYTDLYENKSKDASLFNK